MITTRWVPRTRPYLLAALGLSVLIHFFGGALWPYGAHFVAHVMRRLPEQHQLEQQVATSDVIHLERRTVPRPARQRRAQSAQRSQQRTVPSPARVAAAVAPDVPRPSGRPNRPAPAALPQIVRRALHAPTHSATPDAAKAPGTGALASHPARNAALSASQLAQLNSQFSKTIAATHVDLATIQKETEEQPVAVKRYPMQFTGMQANLQRGQGYITPTTVGQVRGAKIWYYTHYTYMWPDGHIEDDDIPWPFRFPLQHDLFALHVHLIPLQLPPRGFQLSRPLKPFLAHFLRSAGPS